MKKLSDDAFNWFFGIWIISITAGLMSIYWFDVNTQLKMQESLSYSALYQLLQVVSVCLGIMYLAQPLSKLLARNKTLQRWYAEHEAKKWRENK